MTNLPILDILSERPFFLYGLLMALLILLVVKYLKLRSSYTALKSQEDKLKDADYVRRRAEKILENAKNKYEQVIEESYTKAQTIIKDAKVFNDETKQQVLSELGKSIQNITQEIKQETLEEVKGFENDLNQEVAVQKTAVKKVLEGDYDKANAEIASYKAEQLAIIDKQVAEKVASLVEQITTEVFGHGIDLKDQEELVIKSLENARKQSIL